MAQPCIVQIVSSSCKPLLVAEGQEEEDFWSCLGGKKSYQHFDSDRVCKPISTEELYPIFTHLLFSLSFPPGLFLSYTAVFQASTISPSLSFPLLKNRYIYMYMYTHKHTILVHTLYTQYYT